MSETEVAGLLLDTAFTLRDRARTLDRIAADLVAIRWRLIELGCR